MDQKKAPEIASLGHPGLIDLLTKDSPRSTPRRKGAGGRRRRDRPRRGEAVLCTTDSFYEGVGFRPHLFSRSNTWVHKAVTAGMSDILAMNALPAQITVSLGVSSKLARRSPSGPLRRHRLRLQGEQGVDLVGGDTRAR